MGRKFYGKYAAQNEVDGKELILKILRDENISIRRLAGNTDTSSAYLYQILNGQSRMGADLLERFKKEYRKYIDPEPERQSEDTDKLKELRELFKKYEDSNVLAVKMLCDMGLQIIQK